VEIYGTGVLTAPGSSRVIWDFSDGPFETVNQVLIAEARRKGFSIDVVPIVKEEQMGGKPSKGTPTDGRLKKNKAPSPKPAMPKRTKK
jgi:hypothetical protein